MILQLDTENADLDLTSQVTVLTDTPDATNNILCQGVILLGDGAKDLDGTGGNFELTIELGSQTFEPDPETIAVSAGQTRAVFKTPIFPVPANTQVVIKVKSPNGADTDVDITAYLYNIQPVGLGTDGLALISTDAQDLSPSLDVNTKTITAGIIAAATFAAGAIDANALAADAVDEILDEVIEGSYTLRQYMRLFAAALLAKVSGGGTTTVTFRDTGDSKDRIIATVDSSGNRTAVTLDGS